MPEGSNGTAADAPRRVSFVAEDGALTQVQSSRSTSSSPQQEQPHNKEEEDCNGSLQENQSEHQDPSQPTPFLPPRPPHDSSFRSSTNVRSIETGVLTGSSRVSSLELRRLPPEILLIGDIPYSETLDDDEKDLDEKASATQKPSGIIHRLCLNPRFELRKQFLLSFGSLSVISIFFVVITCILTSHFLGENVKETNRETVSQINRKLQGRRARYLAESLDHRLFPREVSEILHEATLDRFAGYPTETEEYSPFEDLETGENFYPIPGPYVPLDWNISDVVTDENVQEHLQTRRDWFKGIPVTSSAVFRMQGNCDVSETNPTAATYFPGCSDAHNDISTGGIVSPSNMTGTIYRKASSLAPFLKALYEYNQDFRDLGLYFANEGSGAFLNYPGFSLNGANNYTSVGCDWMKEPNPYDPSRPIGTADMIEKCHPEGTEVLSRFYNPLEREWCKEQALNPYKTHLEGPSLDAFLSGAWLLTMGQSMYDRITKNFIGCIYVGLRVEFLEDILRDSRVYPNSDISIVRIDEGDVVASSAWNITELGAPPAIYELGIGITQETFEFFKNLVDFETQWVPDDVRKIYENVFIESDEKYFVSHPFPPVPSHYDGKYRPEFLAIISTPNTDIFAAVEDANEGVDDSIDGIMLFSVVTGCAAIFLAAIILVVMSHAITAPLRQMNEVAQQIVDSFGDDSPEAKDFTGQAREWGIAFTPKTEITEVVNNFKQMVSSFSGGSLMARDEDAKHVEVASHFPMRTVFADLYKSRATAAGKELTASNDPTSMAFEEPINLGSNLVVGNAIGGPTDAVILATNKNSRKSRLSSPLFIWTVFLIVIPLILTLIVIAVVSMTALTKEFVETIEESEEFLLDVEIRNLEVNTGLRAAFVSREVSRSIRDLYLITRYASWLLFGGLDLSNGLFAFQNVIDECKGYENPQDCPEAREYDVCDCKWNEKPGACSNYTVFTQKPFIGVQSDGALSNGTRWSTTFPNVSYSRETTQWWRTSELPGHSLPISTVRYATSFSRARYSSAVSPMLTAIDHYPLRTEHGIAYFMGFDDDGMFVGSEGCTTTSSHLSLASFQSTEENGAAEISPQLCPLGRFGYDPRCRDWYDSAKKKKHKYGFPLHVTAPYIFAAEKLVAQSASSPLVDPSNGYYVGQGLYDFSIDRILNILTSRNTPTQPGGFHLLITPGEDNFGGDVVIGPGFLHKEEAAKPVANVVIPNDLLCSRSRKQDCLVRRNDFDSITTKMKTCKEGTESFLRRTDDGTVQKLYLSYFPVRAPFLDLSDPSDFKSGATIAKESCIYSLAIAETEQGLKQPFTSVEDDLHRQVKIAIGCLSGLILLAVAMALFISHNVTRSITEPMRYLLEVIQSVQDQSLDQDLPRLDIGSGSKEIVNVSNTMETLFEVVRFANVAFYAGELEVAYRVLRDSLRIFRGMQNDKAVSVACNNLGNILLVMYLDMKHDEVSAKFGLTRKDIISLGTAYYHEAIKLGEAAYDIFYETEGWTPNCLDFMQHLSNRYFNRAMFLLAIKDDHEQPSEIERLGLRDLEIARDMDVEIVDQGEEVGWGRINRAEKLFQVGLTRVRGLLLLLEMGYPDEWGIDEKLKELSRILNVEARKDSSDLFREIGYAGRLQQIETELMKYDMLQNDLDAAARVAVRALYEDEYLFAETKAEAIQVLMSYVQLNGDKWDSTVRAALKKWLEDSMDAVSTGLNSERQSSVSDAFLTVLSKSLRGNGNESSSMSMKTRSMRFSINEHSCVTMEKF